MLSPSLPLLLPLRRFDSSFTASQRFPTSRERTKGEYAAGHLSLEAFTTCLTITQRRAFHRLSRSHKDCAKIGEQTLTLHLWHSIMILEGVQVVFIHQIPFSRCQLADPFPRRLSRRLSRRLFWGAGFGRVRQSQAIELRERRA